MTHTKFTFFIILTSAAFLYFTSEGRQFCYECNSKDGNCMFNSTQGATEGRCDRDYDVCAVYKKVLPGDAPAQLVRYCDRSPCHHFHTTWETGKYEKTKHCKLCCDDEPLCNNFTVDPCNPSKAGHLHCQIITVALLGLVSVVMGFYS